MSSAKEHGVMRHFRLFLVSVAVGLILEGCNPREMPAPDPDREQPGIVPAPPWKPNPVPSREPQFLQPLRIVK